MKPSEEALLIEEKYNELGSQKETAEILGISPSKVSNYLRLLKLPPETIHKIDQGYLPVSYRPRPQKYSHSIDGENEEILKLIHRKEFVTSRQISEFLKWSEFKSRYVLDNLCRRRLVKKNTDFKPYVFSLGSKGLKFFGLNQQARVVSGLVIHQRLVCNEIESSIRLTNPTAEVVNRDECVERGLNPAISEYLVEYNGGSGLIILDDLMMESSAILHSLLRTHLSSQSQFDLLKTTWLNKVECCLVYSTSRIRQETHDRFWINLRKAEIESSRVGAKRAALQFKIPLSSLNIYQQNKNDLKNIRFESRYIQPFWDII